MMETAAKLLEFTVVRLMFESALELPHARWLRGAIGKEIDRPEFHHHAGKGLVYEHPSIRYDVCGKEGMILGIGEGAFLLRTLPRFESLWLGTATHRIIEQRIESSRCAVGPCEGPVLYNFNSPYLALNQENYHTWETSNPFARRRLLERVVIGNLLSFSKSVNLNVAEQLHAEVDLIPDEWHDLKPGVRLLGFRGCVQVNFMLPERWGIGKSSARGFGTMTREEA